MKKLAVFILLLTVMSFPTNSGAQVWNVFSWNLRSAVINTTFIEHPERLYKIESGREYSVRSYIESIGKNKYMIEIKSPYNFEVDNSYEAIFIKNATTGEVLLKTEGALGVLSGNIQFLTAWQSKAPYLMLPLDDESFALFFAGLLYTGDEAPEMMIVVVRGNEAKVVFDKKAYVYKYTPYPNYSAEYVEDIEWFMTLPDVVPPASVFNKLKRFKIWQEGNILKYKPLN